jgi:hypothetical protein
MSVKKRTRNSEKSTASLCTLNIYQFPRALKQKMKVHAAKHNMTLKEAAVEACEAYLKGRS